MITETVNDAKLDEMFSQDLPCDMCNGPATLMSSGHCCRPPGWRTFKCYNCWVVWTVATELMFIRYGLATHGECKGVVFTVSELSDYREM